MRELLEAGGTVIYEKMFCWLIKHACGTKVTKYNTRGIRPSEVEAVRFVSEHTSIPYLAHTTSESATSPWSLLSARR